MVSLLPLELDLGPLAPHNIWEVIAGIGLALLIWLIYAKFVSPKVEAAYQERAERIQGDLNRAELAQAEAEKVKKKYEDQLKNAHADADEIREKAKHRAAEIVEEARAKAKKESDRILADARLQVQAERISLIKSMRNEIGGFAINLAGRVVRESLVDDERAARTVDRFLDDLAQLPEKTPVVEVD